MREIREGWQKHEARIKTCLQVMQQEMDREKVLENDLNECRKKIHDLGREVSERLCPLEIGKLYRMKSGAMLDWSRVGGRHFRVVRYAKPRYAKDKWCAYINWFNKKGEPFKVYGNEIIGTYLGSSFAENIEVIP